MPRTFHIALVIGLFLPATACGPGGSGNVQIFVVPESSITSGIQSGTDPEEIHDGWTISYDRFLASVGNFRAKRTDTGDTVTASGTFVLDLKNAPTSGYVVDEFRNLAAVRWDKFGYDIPDATEGAQALPPATVEDVRFMVSNGYSLYYEGTATKGGTSIAFRWGFSAGTSFDDCESPDGIPGFAVPLGGTIQIKPTIHGDHELFDNVTQGVEITERLAQWFQTCDANADSVLTLEELRQCDVVLAMPSPPYDLTGVTDQDGDGTLSVYDFVATEMRTLGDYQGDGECPTRTSLH